MRNAKIPGNLFSTDGNEISQNNEQQQFVETFESPLFLFDKNFSTQSFDTTVLHSLTKCSLPIFTPNLSSATSNKVVEHANYAPDSDMEELVLAPSTHKLARQAKQYRKTGKHTPHTQNKIGRHKLHTL